jgi:hypothetical protein
VHRRGKRKPHHAPWLGGEAEAGEGAAPGRSSWLPQPLAAALGRNSRPSGTGMDAAPGLAERAGARPQ